MLELGKEVTVRLGKAWDRFGTLGIAQGRMGNALGILNFAMGAHNCRCGDGFTVGCFGFVCWPKQKGRTRWQTRCKGGAVRGYEKTWKPRK